MKLYFNVNLYLTFILILFALPANAQTVTIDQPLDFGTFVIADNATPRTIAFNAGGSYTADPEYIFFTTPEFGEVTVTGYPALTTLTVTIGTTNMTDCCAGPNFSMSTGFTRPSVVTTDASGEATFEIGATMSSNGDGSTYVDGTFDGTFSVTVTP